MTLRSIVLVLMIACAASSSSAVASPPESPSPQQTAPVKRTEPSPFSLLKFLVVSSAEMAALETDDAIWSRIVRFVLSQDSLTVSSGPTIRRAEGQIRIQLTVEVKMTEGESADNVGKHELDVSRALR